MKFTILITDGKKQIRIPLTEEEIGAMQDLVFMLEGIWDTIKLNKMEKEILSVMDKFTYIGYDIKDRGLFYPYDEKAKKLDKSKPSYHYLVKKPKWKELGE